MPHQRRYPDPASRFQRHSKRVENQTLRLLICARAIGHFAYRLRLRFLVPVIRDSRTCVLVSLVTRQCRLHDELWTQEDMLPLPGFSASCLACGCDGGRISGVARANLAAYLSGHIVRLIQAIAVVLTPSRAVGFASQPFILRSFWPLSRVNMLCRHWHRQARCGASGASRHVPYLIPSEGQPA